MKSEVKKIRPNQKSNLPMIGKVRNGSGAVVYISIIVIIITSLYKPDAKARSEAKKGGKD